MAALHPSWSTLCAAVAAGTFVAGALPISAGADAPATSASHVVAPSNAEARALLDLYAAEAALARARAELAGIEARASAVARAEEATRLQAEIVGRSLAASQTRIAILLRDLYMHGDADPIAIILGASSLSEATTGIDELARATDQNERLAAEATQRGRRLKIVKLELARRRAHLAAVRADARTAAGRLEAAVAGKRRTLASIRAREALTARHLASLQAAAHAATQRSTKLAAAAASGGSSASSASATTGAAATAVSPSPASQAPAAGPRKFVVDAVAYHLPGHTASGLPVGIGVVAVDPNVIPLGTRLFVPGYGAAVAADVGSAVQGAIIDLWMPSTAQARAWGRRTVTITVYG